MPLLFDPMDLSSGSGRLVVRNRLWISPMCQYSVDTLDGMPGDWHLMHLGQFAAGGAGIVFTEATAVSPEGRISPRDTGIWTDEQAAAWAKVAAFLREHGAAPGIQLGHAGRKGSTYAPWGMEGRGTISLGDGGWTPLAPSPVAFGDYAVPEELDLAGIDRVVDDFVAAAVRASVAGFEVIEIHAAHGYLLHQFLSGLSNVRTDEYGGSLENRARLLLRIVGAVRDAVPDQTLFVRLSATDWAEGQDAGAWNVDQCAIVAGWAVQTGADVFDVSSGGSLARPTIPLEPGYQVSLATQIKEQAGVTVSAIGLISEASHADDIVRSGQADAVMVAREALRDPHVALRMARELGVEIDYIPGQYLRAY